MSCYDTKQSDVEATVKLELWGMQNTPSLLSLPAPLWPEVVRPNRILSVGQIELFDIQTECKQMSYAKLTWLKELFDHLTVCKQLLMFN